MRSIFEEIHFMEGVYLVLIWVCAVRAKENWCIIGSMSLASKGSFVSVWDVWNVRNVWNVWFPKGLER
jgi:hypothetical protein